MLWGINESTEPQRLSLSEWKHYKIICIINSEGSFLLKYRLTTTRQDIKLHRQLVLGHN